MPRTQQSSIKSTGGKGKRKALPLASSFDWEMENAIDDGGPLSPLTSSSSPSSPLASPAAPAAQLPEQTKPKRTQKKSVGLEGDWCYSCMDGGKLVICDLCDRAICMTRCITLPLNYEDLTSAKDLSFACPTCHNDAYRKTPRPYFGLYEGKITKNLDDCRKAFPNQPAQVVGPFSLTFASNLVNLNGYIILHFTLNAVPTAGSPASMVHEYLRGFFKDGKSLYFEEIAFNLKDNKAIPVHRKKMFQVAKRLKERPGVPIWLFITTHGDMDRGDLFYSMKNSDVVDSFFEHVVTGSIKAEVQTRQAMCFMMVCGWMAKYEESQCALLDVAQSFQFNHLIAFTVDGLIPSLLSSFMLDMAHRVIVENHDASTFMQGLLQSSPIAARHTSIIHLMVTDNSVNGKLYTWAKRQIRPWGERLPAQCPACLSFRSLQIKTTSTGPATFKCTGKTVAGRSCEHLHVVNSPAIRSEGWKVNGDWISTVWPPPLTPA